MDDIRALRKKLKEAQQECARLREEKEHLKNLLQIKSFDSERSSISTTTPKLNAPFNSDAITQNSSSAAKVALFCSIFRGREDVYPVRWETKKGKSGYSPACRLEWNRLYCDKPRIKCGNCENREFLPLTDQTIYDHLTGKHTIGVYPLLPDDTCLLLAADFDKKSWQEDVVAFLNTCEELSVSAFLERSRSGNGGHVWIFFSKPIPASLARKLGCAILTRTMAKRHQIGFDSYDRLFPSQDTLPRGGFGNLIALPLQKHPREEGSSVFLDKTMQPFPDQWEFLSGVEKMQPSAVEAIVTKAMRAGEVIGVRMSQTSDEAEDDPWTLPPSGEKIEKPIKGILPKTIKAVYADLLYIKKEGLPSELLNRLVRLAAFQNPDFYKSQAMRLPTYNKPRIISCAEDFPNHIGLPRGCLKEADNLLDQLGVDLVIQDERTTGRPLRVGFKGKLRQPQKIAVKELRQYENGVLSAATAFGKTVIAAKLIAVRKRNTLILVHRRQLLDQWRQRLASFLGITESEIGQIGGGRKKITGRLDVGILQSLNHKGEINNIVADYGHVIIDECHHVSAFSFEQIMKKVKAKYILGLTATPVRKDGHHPIVIMQCGPIRFRVHAIDAAKARPFKHIMIPRLTGVQISPEKDQSSVQEIYKLLISDDDRNQLIAEDIIKAVQEGRSPLLLTERIDHLHILESLLSGKVDHLIILKGGMGKKQRTNLAEKLENISSGEERVLLATGRYIGEGFDDPRLDTLFLALPISWRGTLQQYAGRLHRMYGGKKEVHIYDYVDSQIPMLMRMYEKRLKGYKAIGYSISERNGKSERLF